MLCDQREQKILRFSLEKGGGGDVKRRILSVMKHCFRNVKSLPDGKREALALRVRI